MNLGEFFKMYFYAVERPDAYIALKADDEVEWVPADSAAGFIGHRAQSLGEKHPDTPVLFTPVVHQQPKSKKALPSEDSALELVSLFAVIGGSGTPRERRAVSDWIFSEPSAVSAEPTRFVAHWMLFRPLPLDTARGHLNNLYRALEERIAQPELELSLTVEPVTDLARVFLPVPEVNGVRIAQWSWLRRYTDTALLKDFAA